MTPQLTVMAAETDGINGVALTVDGGWLVAVRLPIG